MDEKKTETQASPHLSCTLKPVLSCKLVRLVLCVPAQLNQEMVRGDTLCGLRREQQRVQQHHPSRYRPVSGRPAHRVRLASVRPSACSSGVGGGERGGGKISIRDAPRERRGWKEEDVRMWRGGGSNQSISSQSDGEPIGSWISTRWSCSRWVIRVGGRCVEPKLHPQLSISPPPPPLLSSVIHLPYSLGYSVLVTLYQWAPAGVTLPFLPGWARRHFSAPWKISLELNLTPWCWNKQIHPPKYRCDDLLKVLPPKRCRLF